MVILPLSGSRKQFTVTIAWMMLGNVFTLAWHWKIWNSAMRFFHRNKKKILKRLTTLFSWILSSSLFWIWIKAARTFTNNIIYVEIAIQLVDIFHIKYSSAQIEFNYVTCYLQLISIKKNTCDNYWLSPRSLFVAINFMNSHDCQI